MNNQLAFSTLGCPDWSFEDVIARGHAMGFSAVEIRGIGKELMTNLISCFQTENLPTTQTLLNRYGMKICMIDTSVTLHEQLHWDSAFFEGQQAIDLCTAMHIPAIRVFGDYFPADESFTEVIQRVAKRLAALCTYTQNNGSVRVLLEIHGQFNTVEVLAPLLSQMQKYPAFSLVWDIEHSYRSYGTDFAAFYSLIQPWICHVHIKDCALAGDDVLIKLPGEGTINIEPILTCLQLDGYQGYYSFEWEKRWHRNIPEPEVAFPHYIRFMKKWMRKV